MGDGDVTMKPRVNILYISMVKLKLIIFTHYKWKKERNSPDDKTLCAFHNYLP